MKRVALIVFLAVSIFACRPSTRQKDAGPRAVPSGSAALTSPILSYADVVDRVAPAVVTIRASQRVRAPQQFPFLDDPLFRQFFGGIAPREERRTAESLGSGVIVRSDGHILTNHHVIDGAEQIKVDLIARRTYSARVVGSDPPSDLAVLKIDASDLPVLQPGDSDKVRVGDIALAVGNPLGIGETVTAGIISAKGRATGLSNGSFEDFLQTDAPINRGNSGGALVNTRGELIGINSQIVSPTGTNIGIGFAIPSNMAKNVMEQLIGKGTVRRGSIGISIQNVTSDLAESMGIKAGRGIVVAAVNPGGPGDKAGLKAGDVILQLNGKDVNDTNVFRNTVASTAPGSDVTLVVSRNGAQQELKVRLGELQPEGERPSRRGGNEGEGGGGRLGLTVEPLTPDLAARLELRRGTQGLIVTEVDPSGPAARAGIQPGDVIQEVNRQPVRTTQDVRAALQKSGDRPPLLLINRGGQTVFIPIPS